MKKLILFLLAAFNSMYAASQTNNILPATGNVGIGTTNPNTKLQVNGTAKFDSTVVVMDSMYVTKDIIGAEDIKIDGNAFISGKLFLTGGVDQGSYTNKIAVLDPSGEIKGIGDNMITSSVYQTDCFILTDANGNNLQFPGPAWKSVGGPNYGILHTGTVCPARVGILTSNPLAELDVSGRTYFRTSSGVGIEPNSTSALHVKEINYGGVPSVITPKVFTAEGNWGTFEINRNGQAKIDTEDNDYGMEIINSANNGRGLHIVAGVGNTAPGTYPLVLIETANDSQGIHPVFYIDGKTEIIYGREMKLNGATSWPDYVFEPNYKRMSYQEKEAYFKKEKHLPNIAPASEIENEGVSVTETLSGITKNIEENSLDIIDIYKELCKLKEENNKLKAEVLQLKQKK